jgi:MFS family permease
LIADVAPGAVRGRAFGLRQALDTAGAFIGPLLAIAFMVLLANDFRLVFWIAVIPGAIAVLLVWFGVEDRRAKEGKAAPVRLADLRSLPSGFWMVVIIGVVFTLARFSEAFLILRAHDLGLPVALAPLVLVAMNVVFALGAYPAGALADTRPPRELLLLGLLALILSDLALAFAPGLFAVFGGVALWGLHMALTQGLLSKLVADHAPVALRGTAFGLFNLAAGLAMLTASVVAGLLWDAIGPEATFIAGAAFAAAAALLLLARPSG